MNASEQADFLDSVSREYSEDIAKRCEAKFRQETTFSEALTILDEVISNGAPPVFPSPGRIGCGDALIC